MDFTTTHASGGIPITINGTAYTLPRFLTPELAEWAAEKTQEIVDAATAKLPDAESQARFLLYFQPPPIDVLALIDEQSTPAGYGYMLRKQMKAAGVPDGDAEALIRYGDPVKLRALARQVGSAQQAAAQLAAESNDAGPKADPQSAPVPPSGAERVTTPMTSPSSQPSTTLTAVA